MKYVRSWWEDGGIIQNTYNCFQGKGVSRLMRKNALTLSLLMFWQHFLLMVSCFICRNLTLSLFKKGVFIRNGCFSTMRSISF